MKVLGRALKRDLRFPAAIRPISGLLRGEYVVVFVAGVSTFGGGWVFIHQSGGPVSELLLNAFLYLGLPIAALFGGVILARDSFTLAERRLAALWYIGGICFLLLLVLWSNIPRYTEGGSLLAEVGMYALFGNLGGILGIIAGFNRARAAQNDRLKRIAERRQAQMEFVNRLLRHNILNNVQAINGYASLMEPSPEGENSHYLAEIRSSGQRITEIIDDVRTFMNTLEGNITFERIDLTQILHSQVELLQNRYPEAAITIDIPQRMVIQGNSAFSTVFENLLENAVIHNNRENPELSVTATKVDDMVEIQIADNGPGIPQDVISRYFDKAVPEENEGDSLGLYLVCRMVMMYHGTIRVEENAPRGSIIVLQLPVANR